MLLRSLFKKISLAELDLYLRLSVDHDSRQIAICRIIIELASRYHPSLCIIDMAVAINSTMLMIWSVNKYILVSQLISSNRSSLSSVLRYTYTWLCLCLTLIFMIKTECKVDRI